MKIDEFVSNVLQDIDRGLQEARKHSGRKYAVEGGNNKGVDFDIAVTAENSTTSSAEGQVKAGFVQVIGAGAAGKLETTSGKSEVSRIQFTVYVPFQTEREEREETHIINRSNRSLEENANEIMDKFS